MCERYWHAVSFLSFLSGCCSELSLWCIGFTDCTIGLYTQLFMYLIKWSAHHFAATLPLLVTCWINTSRRCICRRLYAYTLRHTSSRDPTDVNSPPLFSSVMPPPPLQCPHCVSVIELESFPTTNAAVHRFLHSLFKQITTDTIIQFPSCFDECAVLHSLGLKSFLHNSQCVVTHTAYENRIIMCVS